MTQLEQSRNNKAMHAGMLKGSSGASIGKVSMEVFIPLVETVLKLTSTLLDETKISTGPIIFGSVETA